MSFCSRGNVRSRDKTDMAYEKVVTWRVKNLYFHMARDYQTRQDDNVWHWATMHKVTWFFEKRYISNTTSPMDTKLDRVVA